jgi:hypothetical protein
MRIEKGRYRWHASGFTATGAIKSMYLNPTDSISDKLPKSVYLLQSTLPETMTKIRKILVDKFISNTDSRLKRIEGAGHQLHWDKPNEVVNEILYWFK